MSDKLVKKDNTIGGWVIKNQAILEAVVPKQVSADRLLRVAIRAVSSNPKIMACSKLSLMGALSQCFVLGLEPGPTLGHAYLIPFWNSKLGCNEVQLIIGYKGLINLCIRSGKIAGVWTRLIHANEHFIDHGGTENRLEHMPILDTKARGERLGVYAVYQNVDGFKDYECMDNAEVNKIRALSSAKSGPWFDWPDEMARKCPLRRLLKRAPMSIEAATAVRIDDLVASGAAPDYTEVMDAIDVPMIVPYVYVVTL